jgi:hypothetical protein
VVRLVHLAANGLGLEVAEERALGGVAADGEPSEDRGDGARSRVGRVAVCFSLSVDRQSEKESFNKK